MTGISSVLFVCSLNQVRSPMAATIARGLFGKHLFVRSAGIQKGSEDPIVTRVLGELDMPIIRSEPKDITELADANFDLVIVLSDAALPHIEKWAADKSLELEYWPTDDPTQATGNQNQVLDAYRTIRDRLTSRIRDRFASDGRS
ncbi:MAG: hypothetical protein AAFY73_14625 [Pseudomonadota bacterium]